MSPLRRRILLHGPLQAFPSPRSPRKGDLTAHASRVRWCIPQLSVAFLTSFLPRPQSVFEDLLSRDSLTPSACRLVRPPLCWKTSPPLLLKHFPPLFPATVTPLRFPISPSHLPLTLAPRSTNRYPSSTNIVGVQLCRNDSRQSARFVFTMKVHLIRRDR